MSGRETLVLALFVACGRAPGSAAPQPSTSAFTTGAMPSASADPHAAATGPPAAAPVASGANASSPWPALVRDERWDAAWKALEALPETEKQRPEVRYVRARVALERGDAAVALPLLQGLETAMPLLADDVARRRAEAMRVAGPFEEAALWFAARATPSAQLDAARAFEKANDPRRASAAAERVLGSERRTHAQEAEARALRLRLEDTVDEQRADARWLAVQGADWSAVAGVDAPALVAKLDPKHVLGAQELMVRARVLSDAGRTDDALHSIDLAGGAPGSEKLSNRERAHARGMTLFHARGRWSEAARVLTESAGAGGPSAAEDAFHAARALSRADRDEEAIRGYEELRRRFPASTWAQQAAFFVPYLRMLHGEWRECARGFEAYLHAYADGQEAGDARRDGALCKLLDGDTKGARASFERLVEDEADPLVSTRMADMAALAALRDGDRTHAVARWTDVARSRPLSWPALVARARLAEAGAPVPPAIDGAEGSPGSPGEPPPLAVVVPPPADLLHDIGLDADAETAIRERENAVTRGSGGRAPEALCLTYGALGRARRRYQIAQTLPSSLLATGPSPRTRWAWECAFPSPYEESVRAAESSENLPHGLLWAVMRQESSFDPDAVSPARAVGLMQLLPETARPVADELSLAHDDARLTSPPYAIRVGARVLRKLIDQFHGDVPLAIAAYNGGAESVERWISRSPGMQLDAFVERIPFKETRDYVARVMGNLARYGYLDQGDVGVPRLELELHPR